MAETYYSLTELIKLTDNLIAATPTSFYNGIMSVRNGIASIPAADVEPVVRCGECKYGKYTGTEWFCDKHSGHADRFGEDASYHEYHSKCWYCADGIPREKKE